MSKSGFPKVIHTLSSADEMFDLGIRIGSQVKSGDLLLLHGPLGAGKTALTQGIGAGLGIIGVTSPTFVISRTHKVKPPGLSLIHVDAYRLLGDDEPRDQRVNFEFDDLDLDTQREGAVTVIEWGGDFALTLSEDYLLISLSFGKGENQRTAEIFPHGDRWGNFTL